MDKIQFTDAASTEGRIDHDGHSFFGPIPPQSAETRSIYDALIAAGVKSEPYVAPPPLIPQQVPMWAAQAALKGAGKYDAINRAIQGDPTASPPVPSMEASNPAVYFAWTMGNYASRQSAFIKTLAGQFGMSAGDIDAVFVAADKIAQVAG